MNILKEISGILIKTQAIFASDYESYLNKWIDDNASTSPLLNQSFGFFCFDLIMHGVIS